MGGCRCTFRNCENSTSSRPGMHFFHFPVRDWDRLEVWAANADKLEFKELPLSKLKNKVVCQDHFENRMFMNYLQEGLIKTAVPKLVVLDDGNVWNVETNEVTDREVWEIPEKDSSTAEGESQVSSQTTRMEIQFLDANQEEFSITPVQEDKPEPPEESSTPVPIKIVMAEKPSSKPPPMTPPSNAILRKVVIKRKNSPATDPLQRPPKLQLLTIQKIPKESPSKAEHQREPVPEEAPSATPSSSTDVTLEDKVATKPAPPTAPPPSPAAPPVVQIMTDPTYVKKLEQTTSAIEELKNLLTDVLNKPVPEPKVITVPVPTPVVAPQPEPSGGSSSPKAEKGPHMNKVQLFNGIKRYLNPTMVAMLRMELFAGSTERQWKPDEKTLAVELNNLGEKVYDHFCDEFRFRLPPKKDVQKWKEEALDDDDAS